MYVSVCSPGRVGHGDAEGVVEGGKLVRFEELGVDVDALLKAVCSPHFDLLHGVLAGDWRANTPTGEQTHRHSSFNHTNATN